MSVLNIVISPGAYSVFASLSLPTCLHTHIHHTVHKLCLGVNVSWCGQSPACNILNTDNLQFLWNGHVHVVCMCATLLEVSLHADEASNYQWVIQGKGQMSHSLSAIVHNMCIYMCVPLHGYLWCL